jgi:divalent metal cation (Fe/Co/Zn/Cd) transporter
VCLPSPEEPVLHDSQLESLDSELLRAGIRVSAVSIGWTVVASTTAITIGVASNSLVLASFGATAAMDAVGSAALLAHFRHALRHEAISEYRERVALRIVTIGLLLVGATTLFESVRRLLNGLQGEASLVGVVVSAASAVALAWLSLRKRQVGRRLGSRALIADGWLSATGGLLAAVTLIGAGLTLAWGWWVADPMAAAFIAVGALAAAIVLSPRIGSGST